jgi:hypothetical protein
MRYASIAWIVFVAACGGGSARIDGPPGGGDDAPTPDAPVVPPTCDAPPTFAAGIAPSQTLHVEAGAAPGGDGSPGAPFATIEAAANAATPGTAIRLGPGNHATGQFVSDLRGTAAAPIWIGGEPGQPLPILDGGPGAIQLVRPAYVVVHDLEVRNQSANGINIDDGGDFDNDTAAHHVAVQDVHVHDVGSGGNEDCIKVSGINDLFIYDSVIERCGGGGAGSGVDHVGCHRSIVARNRFIGMSGNAVQAKGGSTDVDVRQNLVRDGGERAVNLGGSTDLDLFRPSLSTTVTNAEARRIRVFANVFAGTMRAPVAFVGCIDCLVAHNAVVGAPNWIVRILQETVTQGGFTFEPAANGRVINNSFVFTTALSTAVNVGADTAADTFTFSHNLWLAADDPAQSTPDLPVAEDGSIIGTGSAYAGLTDPFTGVSCAATDREAGAGLDLPEIAGAVDGACWTAPRSIGPASCAF